MDLQEAIIGPYGTPGGYNRAIWYPRRLYMDLQEAIWTSTDLQEAIWTSTDLQMAIYDLQEAI